MELNTENSILETQNKHIEKVKKWNDDCFEKTGKRRKFYCLTMGCQMNAHDSEKITAILSKMGYDKTDIENEADFIIYNTCCVRENAEEKVFGKLGFLKHLKRQNPDLIIALCGCMMQEDFVIDKIRQSYRYTDIIFGTFNFHKLPELILSRIETGEQVIDIWKEHGEIVEDTDYDREYSYKASVNIMYGCNNFCTYCIVPYVRGRERSREKEDILNEIKHLVKDGVKEITLLGQNVNSYGKTLAEPVTFAQLLREVNEIEGLERIRFMTSHPKDLSDELIYAMRDCHKVCNYLHLPFQAGSNTVLKKMNRGYTKEKYLNLVEKIRKEIPDIMISTDIIVAFPQETEEDFEDTLDVVRKANFSTAFTFIYSKRIGTPAAKMEGQIDEKTAHARFDRLLETLNSGIHSLQENKLGKTFGVLVEKPSSQEGIMTGRSTDNTLIHFKGDESLIGKTVDVKILENKTFYLIGEMI